MTDNTNSGSLAKDTPKVVGKKTTDFPNDDEITGEEVIYAVDNKRDVNITTEQIKNFTLNELNKNGVETIKLSSMGW